MLYLITALATYFIWTYIHELSHLIVMKRFVQMKSAVIKPYPHRHPTLGFVFGSVSYDYEGHITLKQDAWMSFAPRYADVLGCVLLLCSNNPYWTIFFLGAWVDLVRGTIPHKETSDIVRYCKGFDVPIFDVMVTQTLFCMATLALKVFMFT
jgi:hypothetical protein